MSPLPRWSNAQFYFLFFFIVAGDQYGNYLVQWVLINAASHQRELVASHIRYGCSLAP